MHLMVLKCLQHKDMDLIRCGSKYMCLCQALRVTAVRDEGHGECARKAVTLYLFLMNTDPPFKCKVA
jgi:hypothetical protein